MKEITGATAQGENTRVDKAASQIAPAPAFAYCAKIDQEEGRAMMIEIQKPELEALIRERMQKGGFASIEDALMQALEASPMVGEHQEKSRDQRTGADLIAALQASPYRELDIEPSRFRLSMPARDVTF